MTAAAGTGLRLHPTPSLGLDGLQPATPHSAAPTATDGGFVTGPDSPAGAGGAGARGTGSSGSARALGSGAAGVQASTSRRVLMGWMKPNLAPLRLSARTMSVGAGGRIGGGGGGGGGPAGGGSDVATGPLARQGTSLEVSTARASTVAEGKWDLWPRSKAL